MIIFVHYVLIPLVILVGTLVIRTELLQGGSRRGQWRHGRRRISSHSIVVRQSPQPHTYPWMVTHPAPSTSVAHSPAQALSDADFDTGTDPTWLGMVGVPVSLWMAADTPEALAELVARRDAGEFTVLAPARPGSEPEWVHGVSTNGVGWRVPRHPLIAIPTREREGEDEDPDYPDPDHPAAYPITVRAPVAELLAMGFTSAQVARALWEQGAAVDPQLSVAMRSISEVKATLAEQIRQAEILIQTPFAGDDGRVVAVAHIEPSQPSQPRQGVATHWRRAVGEQRACWRGAGACSATKCLIASLQAERAPCWALPPVTVSSGHVVDLFQPPNPFRDKLDSKG